MNCPICNSILFMDDKYLSCKTSSHNFNLVPISNRKPDRLTQSLYTADYNLIIYENSITLYYPFKENKRYPQIFNIPFKLKPKYLILDNLINDINKLQMFSWKIVRYVTLNSPIIITIIILVAQKLITSLGIITTRHITDQ